MADSSFATLPDAPVALERIDPQVVQGTDGQTMPGEHSAQYEELTLNLLMAARHKRVQRVLVGSAQHGEGRTTVTLNLAAALTRNGQRVLVVDCDFLQPSVARLLGIVPTRPFTEPIAPGAHPSTAVVRVMPRGFDLLFPGATVTNPLHSLTSRVFSDLLQMLRPYYNFILIDTSPLLDAAHPHLLARLADGVLLVVQPGATTSDQMRRAVAHLDPDDLLGVVLNQVSA